MYIENNPLTDEKVNIYADNVPEVEGSTLDVALPYRKQHFEVKKNDLFNSMLDRPEMKEILEPENYNDVIDAIVLKPVIKAEEGKIDVDSTFELILERPTEPISEEAKKVSFCSMEPDILEVGEEGELNALVDLGQTYVNCNWRSGVSKDLLVTIGEVSEIKPFLPGSGNTNTPGDDVIVVPGIPVTTMEEILAALEAGEEEIKLEADIETSDYIEIRDKKLVINLNGHVITHPANSGASYKDVFEVYGTGELTINGEGKVIAEDGYCIYSTGDSKVNLNGGYYFSPVSVVDARKNSSVTINGGEFFVDGSNNPDGDFGQKFTLNLRDKTGNYAGELSEIVVKGGKYYKFDPANNESNGAGTNYVADGYVSVQEGDYFVVSEKETEDEEPVVGEAKIKYALMPLAEHMESVDKITMEDLAGLKYTEYPVEAMDKTQAPIEADKMVIILIPAESGLKAMKDNGLGTQEEFAESVFGANGQYTYTIDGIEYKLYGELFTVGGEDSDFFIYIV